MSKFHIGDKVDVLVKGVTVYDVTDEKYDLDWPVITDEHLTKHKPELPTVNSAVVWVEEAPIMLVRVDGSWWDVNDTVNNFSDREVKGMDYEILFDGVKK